MMDDEGELSAEARALIEQTALEHINENAKRAAELIGRGFTPRISMTSTPQGETREERWDHHSTQRGVTWPDVALVAVLLTFALFILKGVPW